ncbi:MAG: NUDIX domain-containing protein [Nanoarchaeota archaeon]|nr:NUDIX domain-containing protein [Nanoarchaeota archaeon]
MKYGTMAYLNVGGKVLLLKKFERNNDPNSGFWTLPGGKLEDFEKGIVNPRGRLESVIRETEDETGITLINPVLKGAILFDNSERIFSNWSKKEDYLVHIFSAKGYKGALRQSDEGIPEFIDERLLTSIPQNEGDKMMYKWLENGRNFVGIIKHTGNRIDEEGTFVDYF